MIAVPISLLAVSWELLPATRAVCIPPDTHSSRSLPPTSVLVCWVSLCFKSVLLPLLSSDLWPVCLSLQLENPCHYVAPTQMIQDNLILMFEVLIPSTESPLPCGVTLSQVLGIRAWALWGIITQFRTKYYYKRPCFISDEAEGRRWGVPQSTG